MYTQEEVKATFRELCNMPAETEWLEFKKAGNNFSFEKIGKYFSALGNEANLKKQRFGWLIFGVNDTHPRQIVGTNYRRDRASLDQLKHEISGGTNGITFQEIYELYLPEGRVLLLQIPPAPAGIPIAWKGHFYGREGESLGPLAIHEIEEIRGQASMFDWSAEICAEASLEDLDKEALEIAKAKFAAKYPKLLELSKNWDLSQFLDKTKLTRGGQITRAAILLLGKPEGAHFLLPNPAQITWKLDSDDKGYEHFGPPFLTAVEDIFQRIRNTKFRIQPFNRLIPYELTKYDSGTVLEALNNCLAHQDYSQNARIIITEKNDRLILQNIGDFYDGTVEDYVLRERTPERYRNPFLTQAMVSLDMIDTMGMGIRRMFLTQRKRYFPLPEYDFSDRNHVVMTIYGKLIDENYSRMLIEKEDLSLAEVISLDKIQKKQELPHREVAVLRKKKLVEGRYPHVFVASGIAKATEQEVEYTRHRAFDKQYYKDMIFAFLRQHGEATPIDLQRLLFDKLSDLLSEKQRRDKVRNLLQEMAREGRIENVGGRGYGAVWKRKNQ